jgi:RNA polymerase sigma factor (sigma-70 family)
LVPHFPSQPREHCPREQPNAVEHRLGSAGTGTGLQRDDEQAERLVALIARIAVRDEDALAALYDAVLGRVHGLVRRIVLDARIAEEVTADVFFQIWRQADRYDPARGRPLGWILAIARTRALDSLRRLDPAAAHPDPASLFTEAMIACASPQDILGAAQDATHLRAAVDQLEPLPRQLLALAYFRGLTHEEIAAQSNLPLGTVKSHLRRALISLRNTLGFRMERSPEAS